MLQHPAKHLSPHHHALFPMTGKSGRRAQPSNVDAGYTVTEFMPVSPEASTRPRYLFLRLFRIGSTGSDFSSYGGQNKPENTPSPRFEFGYDGTVLESSDADVEICASPERFFRLVHPLKQ